MQNLKKILLNSFLITIALGMVFPMAWMLLISLKAIPSSDANFFELLFSSYTLQNFLEAFETDAFGTYFFNSILVALCVTAGNVFLSFLVAYALARRQFFGKTVIFASILAVLIVPAHVIMIPLYRLMVNFNWINSYYSLIIPWLVTPFAVFLIRQYILSLPRELEDAARIDGASEWYLIFKIAMPLCKPILTVVAIYVFLNNWNSFLFPFLFANDEAHRTLPVGLTFYLGKQSIDWGHLMAGAAISAMPIILIFLLFQRQVIKGLTAGALKE
ncbi:MAG: carbohydrate ABC transporter permease [Ignavibacteria bacterium]|nr:carbohydrate ABC transporter permease [Ignavibacteria bacterium]